MADGRPLVQWAPRVPQGLIQRLYASDARGIYDDELLDEVGWGLYFRCESFVAAVEAAHGRAKCAGCGEIVLHTGDPEEVLHCATCGWEVSWGSYFKSIRHKQLSGAAPVVEFFQDYVTRFPSAGSPQAKMLLIDALIHGFHQSLHGDPTRTTAVNLIQGTYHEVVDFLDRLAYGDDSTAGTRETWLEWRAKINRTAEEWGDERLRRPG